MLLPVLLGVVVLLALRRGGTASPPPGDNDVQTTKAQGDGTNTSPGDTVSKIVGSVGAAAGAAASVVGALSSAGLFSGSGAAAAAGGSAIAGGTSGAAAGGTTASSAGAAAEGASGGLGAASSGSATTAGSIAASTVLFEAGVFAVLLALEVLFAWSLWAIATESAKWGTAYQRDPTKRLAAQWWGAETDTVQKIFDPSYGQRLIDPRTSKPVPIQTYWNDDPGDRRPPITEIAALGIRVDINLLRPTHLALPAAEVLRVYRTARYLALRQLEVDNAVRFWFYARGFNVPGAVDSNGWTLNAQGIWPVDFKSWRDAMLREEPWAPELGIRCNANMAQLEQAARESLGQNFELAVKRVEFFGRAGALATCAVNGWPWFGWPGDYGFNKLTVEYAGLGGNPGRTAGNTDFQSQLANGDWAVDAYFVAGGNRWVAVDPVTRLGVDLQASRQNGKAVIYSPEDLRIGTTETPRDRWVPAVVTKPVVKTKTLGVA